MSQSDFLIRRSVNDAAGLYFTGSAILNDTLSNPLSSSINCRVFNEDNQNGWIGGMYFISSSVSGGAFINISENKSVSIRAWGRFNNITNNGDNTFSLLAKHNGYNTGLGTSPTWPGNTSYAPRSGYEFGFDYNNSGRLFYRFGNYKSNDQERNFIPGYTSLSLNDKWIGLRMDISPVRINKIINGTPVSGTFKDIITLYTASYDAPDTWAQIANYELLADDNQFVPWGSYSPIGTANGSPSSWEPTSITTSSYGFFHIGNYGTNNRSYFDDFQIIVEDAF